MKVSDVTDEMLDKCSYIVVYSTTNEGDHPFFTEEDKIKDSYQNIQWLLHCDWQSKDQDDEEDEEEEWKSWQHGWGRDAKIVFNDVKDLIPKPHRFVVFRPNQVDYKDYKDDKDDIDLPNMIMRWISSDEDENDENDENYEKERDKTKMEKTMLFFNRCLEDFSSACYISIESGDLPNMTVTIRDEYIFVKWEYE